MMLIDCLLWHRFHNDEKLSFRFYKTSFKELLRGKSYSELFHYTQQKIIGFVLGIERSCMQVVPLTCF